MSAIHAIHLIHITPLFLHQVHNIPRLHIPHRQLHNSHRLYRHRVRNSRHLCRRQVHSSHRLCRHNQVHSSLRRCRHRGLCNPARCRHLHRARYYPAQYRHREMQSRPFLRCCYVHPHPPELMNCFPYRHRGRMKLSCFEMSALTPLRSAFFYCFYQPLSSPCCSPHVP